MGKEELQTFNPSASEYLAVGKNLAKAGFVHVKASRRLHKEGIPWYPSGSFLLPIISDLTERTVPDTVLPLITHLNHYMRQTDDFFDEREDFPSWSECKYGVQQTQSVLLHAISQSDIDPSKKRMIFHEIAGLRRNAYLSLQQKDRWKESPTFEEAYTHRVNTTGLFSRIVADIWCIVTDTSKEKQAGAKDALQRIGMTFQYIDDLMDIRDDTDTDGNLVLATLNENAEERQEVTQVLTDIKGKPRVLDLLTRFAPQSTNTLLRRMDEEAASLRNISSSTERTIRGTVKLILPRIVISSDSFYRKIAVW
ncbi:MAG: hypothetical protein UU67_C0020G0013 [Candidatus Daviesbacteria bacterium GW2011_GWB1_41_5]|uniref:Polyprenyl synthetase n=1 Tax=Candidatus Daviesbacteria bacterium GW2011_GWB1_41_5 TaxID=1618429 RepID=A0A0G0WNP3_9BACT|nr:MAG: hypothetical protein UU67_C0020G0013 [Candidatus Daviesbacteria bacterium GW2011_GWB1_41_5]